MISFCGVDVKPGSVHGQAASESTFQVGPQVRAALRVFDVLEDDLEGPFLIVFVRVLEELAVCTKKVVVVVVEGKTRRDFICNTENRAV